MSQVPFVDSVDEEFQTFGRGRSAEIDLAVEIGAGIIAVRRAEPEVMETDSIELNNKVKYRNLPPFVTYCHGINSGNELDLRRWQRGIFVAEDRRVRLLRIAQKVPVPTSSEVRRKLEWSASLI